MKGESIPTGWAVDGQGRDTRDPRLDILTHCIGLRHPTVSGSFSPFELQSCDVSSTVLGQTGIVRNSTIKAAVTNTKGSVEKLSPKESHEGTVFPDCPEDFSQLLRLSKS